MTATETAAIDARLRERWFQLEDARPESSGSIWRFDMPEGWAQGRSAFGGLTVAAAVSLARRNVDASRVLRTVSTQLMRPAVPGPITGRFTLLREGKSVTFAEVRLSQNDSEVAVVSAVFGVPREQAMVVEPTARFEGKGPEDGLELPYVEGVTPEFTQHVAMRWVEGTPPFMSSPSPRFVGHCRFRCPAGGEEGMVALLDVWPSPTLSMMSKPAFASTVTWTAHLLEPPPTTQEGWFGFEYETIRGGAGFHTAVGKLYSPAGELIAFTEQLVAVFA